MPPPYEVRSSWRLPQPSARCNECRWIAGEGDPRPQAFAHARNTGHRTIIPLLGHVAYEPVLDHEREVTS